MTITIEDVYFMEPRIKDWVNWIKAEQKPRRWDVARNTLRMMVGYERVYTPTEDTLPLYTAAAYDLVLREIYKYID